MKAKAANGSQIRCVVLIPVGPRTAVRHLSDTILSVIRFVRSEFRIVLIDNTTDGLRLDDLPNSDAIEIVRIQGSEDYSVFGRLYIQSSHAIEHVLDTWPFDLMLRLDDDALLIGSGAEEEAMDVFKANPGVGLLGSYRVTCMGATRDFGPCARRLWLEMSMFGRMIDPSRWRSLREIYSFAAIHGYEAGEHCLGAASFYRREVLAAMRDNGFLSRTDLMTTRLCDDQLFGMLVKAAGYQIMDFAGPGRPLGLAWKGLPASPQMLLAIGKKIVHSVKSWKGNDQDQIRREFALLVDVIPANVSRPLTQPDLNRSSVLPAVLDGGALFRREGTRP